MTATIPTQTTGDNIDHLLTYLGSKPGWVDAASVKTHLGPAGDTRKLNALHFLGIVERDGANVKLTTNGREIHRASGEKRQAAFAQQMKTAPAYSDTLDWIYWQNLEGPTKVDVASHWIDTEPQGTEGAAEGLVSDGVICFFRLAEYAGLGKFVNAGRGREARLDVARDQLKSLVDASNSEPGRPADDAEDEARVPPTPPIPPPLPPAGRVNFEPGVRVNVEIHIAADATPETIEEIFKNMRRYVLNDSESDVES